MGEYRQLPLLFGKSRQAAQASDTSGEEMAVSEEGRMGKRGGKRQGNGWEPCRIGPASAAADVAVEQKEKKTGKAGGGGGEKCCRIGSTAM